MGDLEDIEKMVNKRQKVNEAFSKGAQKSGLAPADVPVTKPNPVQNPVQNPDVEPGWRKKISGLFGGK
jgi:hypothetical protein